MRGTLKGLHFPVRPARGRFLRLPLQTGLQTHRRAFRGKHTPLINLTTINFPPSRLRNVPLTKWYEEIIISTVATLPRYRRASTPPCSHQTYRVLRHYNNAAAWQRCGIKRRSGNESTACPRHVEIPVKPSPRRMRAILTTKCVFPLWVEGIGVPQTARQRQTPSSLFSSSHKHGRTTHNNFGSLGAKNQPTVTSAV